MIRPATMFRFAAPIFCLCLVVAQWAPVAHADTKSNLPSGFDPQWNLKVIQAPKAWQITKGDPNIVVGVIDTGVDLSHKEFAGRLVPGANLSGMGDANDMNGHGTFVAGIIAGATTGVAPNVKIMPLRVFDGNGNSKNTYIAEAIRYGVNHGVRIFNLSLGGLKESDELADAIKFAYSKGALLICAAGNSGREMGAVSSPYPAASKGAFGVAATTANDKPASYSSAGPWVKVSAPGGDHSEVMRNDPMYTIYGAQPGNKMGQFESFVGTSFAAPHVAGLAALVWSVNPELSNTQVEQILMRTADRPWSGGAEYSEQMGFGRINALRAVMSALPRDIRLNVVTPHSGATAGQQVMITGWAANLRGDFGQVIDEVRVFLDGPVGQGSEIGSAQYPLPTASLTATTAAATTTDTPPCASCAFTFTWDTAKTDAGLKTLYVGAKTLTDDWVWAQVVVNVEK